MPAPALLRLKWLETAFAEDAGGALLAFRAGRHRAILSEMAWDVFKKDKYSAPFAVNTYNRTHKYIAAKYPDWFKDEAEFQSE